MDWLLMATKSTSGIRISSWNCVEMNDVGLAAEDAPQQIKGTEEAHHDEEKDEMDVGEV